MKLRTALYLGARALGDVDAARRGPKSLGRRYVRKAAYRATNRTLARSLRKLGL